MKKKIGLIGAGQLGSRHLQGLGSLGENVEVFVVDPSNESLNMSLERHRQVDTGLTQSIHLLNQITSLPKNLDLVIVATTSDVRHKILIDLLLHAEVKNLILEKVLFQNLDEYHKVLGLKLLEGVNVWVNLAQRLWPFFIDIKKNYYNDPCLDIHISGSQWGLGCNSVHNVDIASFLWAGDLQTTAILDKDLLPSKRPQFVEFSGEVCTKSENGGCIKQVCYSRGDAPFVISATHPEFKVHWDVSNGIKYSSNKNNGWIFEPQECIAPYQSNLTTTFVNDIFNNGTCGLPLLEESCRIHVQTIKALLLSASNEGHDFGNTCPIT